MVIRGPFPQCRRRRRPAELRGSRSLATGGASSTQLRNWLCSVPQNLAPQPIGCRLRSGGLPRNEATVGQADTFGSSAAQTFDSKGASATIAAEFDPIEELKKEGGNGNVCKETKSETEPNTATYTMTSPGFTMLGLPTITADVATTGAYGQIDARLWDVLPSGEERIVTRGVLSPDRKPDRRDQVPAAW
jgi:hypothetical protein